MSSSLIQSKEESLYDERLKFQRPFFSSKKRGSDYIFDTNRNDSNNNNNINNSLKSAAISTKNTLEEGKKFQTNSRSDDGFFLSA